ncbi:THAP domain-containing protein 6-like [Nilaparvata lugens]|uniref:THAP domain-containing protein 6-like n=1 Tax=Nilaparvata lugens TaxID=108931 RepID=UPI00193CA6E6|nr:THAP domain-containing protein 6-like [Nilaparvata lugens]
MPAYCIAYGCFNKGGNVEGITFHSFPKNEDLRRKWIIATKRKDWEPTKYSKICSAHFREDDIDRTSLNSVRIREGAVPAIFPAFPEESQVKDRQNLKRRTEEPQQSA